MGTTCNEGPLHTTVLRQIYLYWQWLLGHQKKNPFGVIGSLKFRSSVYLKYITKNIAGEVEPSIILWKFSGYYLFSKNLTNIQAKQISFKKNTYTNISCISKRIIYVYVSKLEHLQIWNHHLLLTFKSFNKLRISEFASKPSTTIKLEKNGSLHL